MSNPSSHDAPTSGANPPDPTVLPEKAGRAPFRSVGGPPMEGAGDSIGPYKLLSLLGEGGFGLVYLAERREPIVQRVAIKVIKPGMDSRAVVARFEAERQALALMDHPNVAKVFDAGATATGRPYFVMEYVQGESITAYCDRQTLDTRDRLSLFAEVCEAVQHAHHKGIIHRDLKPSNILVSIKDGKAIPKVIDFGVAKAISQPLTEKSIFTELGQLIGTPEYMSPEQAEMGALDIDTRTDVYSLGVVLYELLTGAVPFDARTLRSAGYEEIRRIIREVDPPRPSTRLSSLGESAAAIAQRRHTQLGSLEKELRSELEWIPLKAIRKDRTQRYRTPLELADDIRNYLGGRPLIAGPESAAYKARKFLRRHRAPVLAGSLIALALVAGVIGTSVGMVKARRARAVATEEATVSSAATKFMEQMLQLANPARKRPVVFGQAQQPDLTGLQLVLAGAERVETQLKDAPKVRAVMHETYARVLRSYGEYAKAEEHANKAIDLVKSLRGEADPRIANLHRLLGTIALDLGKDRLARDYAAKAGGLDSTDPEAQAYSLDFRALEFHNAGDYDESEYRGRAAAELWKKAPVSDEAGAAHLAYTQGNLGRLLIDAGRVTEGAALMAESLSRRRALDGDPSMSAAYGLLGVGYAQHAAGDGAAAARSYREARDMYIGRLENPKVPVIAMVRMDLAGVLEDFGLPAQADPTGGSESQFTGDQLGSMAWLQAISFRNRARILHRLGKVEQGNALFARAIAIIAATVPEPETAGVWEAHTRRVWADLLLIGGQSDRGLEQYQLALALQRKWLPEEEKPAMVPTLIGLADALVRLGRAPEAEPFAAEAVKLRRDYLPDDAWLVAVARTARGRVLTALGRFDDAQTELQAAGRDLSAALGERDPRAAAARTALAELAAARAAGKPTTP